MAVDGPRRRTQEERLKSAQESAVKAEQERVTAAAKTTRLRALRLAKEAADRDAMLLAAPPPRRTRGSLRSRGTNEAT